MVYAFTETEKNLINNYGYSVVEFKAVLKKIYVAVKKLFSDILEMINKIEKCSVDFADDVNFFINEIYESFNMEKTSNRYKAVNILSRYTGIKRKCVWDLTRPLYFPRSN